jgi:hypothetical protein
MPVSAPSRSGAIQALFAAALLLLVAALAVRGKRPAAPLDPAERGEVTRKLVEPMQFLSAQARLRVDELIEHVEPERRGNFLRAARLPFDLEDCPDIRKWLGTADGQEFERLVVELRRGTREEAFAGLALLFQLGRATDWNPPRMSSDSASTERYAELLHDWLAAWAERGARDELLREPALSAFLVYGRAMRMAYEAAWVGRKDGPLERAKAFSLELTGADQARHTDFGQELQRTYPAAFSALSGAKDLLSGASSQAKSSFPEIDGECGS